jgi:hypothetical protein
MNQWKPGHAVKADVRTLDQAVKDSDVLIGVLVKGAVTADTVRSMADPDTENTRILRGITERARVSQADIIFAEGDDPRVLRVAVMYQRSGFGKSLVVGPEADVQEKLEAAGLADAVSELQIVNAGYTPNLEVFKDLHYNRLKRKGLIGQMFTDVQPETDMFFRL